MGHAEHVEKRCREDIRNCVNKGAESCVGVGAHQLEDKAEGEQYLDKAECIPNNLRAAIQGFRA